MLSVIVVSFNSAAILARCLAALWPQIEPDEVTVLVVGRWPDDQPPHDLCSRFPWVQWLAAPAEATIPQMRSRGIECSQGDIVALLEDDCVVTESWRREVILVHQSPYPAIGGPIEPGDYGKGLDWGVYFCEYGRFMRPYSGIVSALPGNNVTYKRNALEKVDMREGFYEVFIHEQWQQAGQKLLADDKLAVHNINIWSGKNVTTVPYHHGRAFAGMRLSDQPVWRRLLYAVLAIGLPVIQIARLLRVILARQRYRSVFIKSLPWITLFYICWAVGEWMGYLFGSGKSASQWR